MDYASQILAENWGVERQEKIATAIRGSTKAAEFSFSAIGADPSEGGFSDAFSEESNAHIKKLHARWYELKNKLQQYTHENLDPENAQASSH